MKNVIRICSCIVFFLALYNCSTDNYAIEQQINKTIVKNFNVIRDSIQKDMDSLCVLYKNEHLQSTADSIRAVEWEKIKKIIMTNEERPQ